MFILKRGIHSEFLLACLPLVLCLLFTGVWLLSWSSECVGEVQGTFWYVWYILPESKRSKENEQKRCPNCNKELWRQSLGNLGRTKPELHYHKKHIIHWLNWTSQICHMNKNKSDQWPHTSIRMNKQIKLLHNHCLCTSALVTISHNSSWNTYLS